MGIISESIHAINYDRGFLPMWLWGYVGLLALPFAITLVYFNPLPLIHAYPPTTISSFAALVGFLISLCLTLGLAKRKVKHDTDTNTIQRDVN